MVKYRVVLTDDERKELHAMLGKGQCAARKLTRARILLLTDEGRSERDIASILSASRVTVETIRRRCAEEGVATALSERKRPGAQRKLDERAQARLIAEACSMPGDGHARWTLKLLAGRVVELGLVESIAPETIRSYLKKTNSNRGRSRSGAFLR